MPKSTKYAIVGAVVASAIAIGVQQWRRAEYNRKLPPAAKIEKPGAPVEYVAGKPPPPLP
jgi:hypothetical protein